MLTYPCPKGHASIESDYCSECGTKISANAPLAPLPPCPSAPSPGSPTLCPDCTAPHDLSSGNFCEICGFNFTTGAQGQLPIVPTASNDFVARSAIVDVLVEPEPVALEPLAPEPLSNDSPIAGWEIVITIDPIPHDPASPPPPTQVPPLTLVLSQPINLIGRTSEKRAIHPEIAIDFDDAVSHRHALLTLQPDGSLVLRDIGSSNGTQLNGTEITALVDTPVKNGDAITIGHWTRLTVQPAPL